MVRATTAADRNILATLHAHRVAWELENGPITNGSLVLHRCDNRACVRPSHLFIGDDKANMDDMYEKERDNHARGADQHLAKLTERRVKAIRSARARGVTVVELAERFDVSHVAVSAAATGRTWKHVEGALIKPQEKRRLTDEDVRVIRAERAKTPPTTLEELATRFDVAISTVSRIANRRRQQHVS
jgi:transcriptional regulator with XRE-family HTH domain